MANQWFKFYGGEYLADPKIERLTPIERSCWLTILCMASMSDDGVIQFLTVETLLNRSGIQFDPYHPEEWEGALGVLTKFSNLKMIDAGIDGRITLINWDKRQEHAMTVAERVAKHRAKSKVSNENVTSRVTNVTTEEKRIEENRIEQKKEIAISKEIEVSSVKDTVKNILKKKIDNKLEEQIPSCISCFKILVLESELKDWFTNSTQRRACIKLIDHYGTSTVSKVTAMLKIFSRAKELRSDDTIPQTTRRKYFKTFNSKIPYKISELANNLSSNIELAKSIRSELAEYDQ
jgi:hypothetical protein